MESVVTNFKIEKDSIEKLLVVGSTAISLEVSVVADLESEKDLTE